MSDLNRVRIINSYRRIPVHRLKYLRQSISLTGGGSATFSSALDAVQVIYRQFDRRFPEGVLDAWSTDSTLDSLDISNRYFTPLKNVSGLENVAFHKGVDPRNILRDMAKSDHIHTEDNYVAYFSMHKDINGQKKYVTKVFHWSGAYYFTGYADLRAANHRFSAWATLFKLNYGSSLFQ
jgi:hypothetical protein